MSENDKEIPIVPEFVKTLLGFPSYEDTPRKPENSYVSHKFTSSFMAELENNDSSFSYNFQNGSKSFEGNLSKIAEQFSDSDFFDSETGKEMILADQALRESSPLQLQGENSNSPIPGCSSWVPCTRKKVKDIPRLLYDVNIRNQDSDVRISQYMKVYSESLGDSSLQLTSFNPDISATSTPVKKRMSLLSCNLETQTKDNFDFSNVTFRENTNDFQSFNSSSNNNFQLEYPIRDPRKTFYSTPVMMEMYKQYMGSSNYKQLKRLEAAEAAKNTLSICESPMDSLYSYNKRFVTAKEDETTLVQQGTPEWLLNPNKVIMDSRKGARVLLINKSDKTLRFTSSCDGKVVNICPLCGVIPARSQIGLRIVISQHVRKSHENAEDEIKIFVGKEVQTIHLRIVNEQKPKTFTERRFITY